jgi:hypothetical protein
MIDLRLGRWQAAMEGRRCITSEEKPEHYAIARKRLDRGYQPGLI